MTDGAGPVADVTMVVAASTNDVIGRDGELPWRLPEDLKRFRELTLGKPVVMGRRTCESIGRPLPGRRNIVVSRQEGLKIDGCEVVNSPQAALTVARADKRGQGGEVMVIGGEQIYKDFLPYADRIHLTRVHAILDGNAFFPALPPGEWHVVWSEPHPATEDQPLAFTFEVLERRKTAG